MIKGALCNLQVSVCNTREEVCIPDCDSKKIKEIRRQKRSRKSNLSDKDKDRLKKLRIKTKRNEVSYI